MDTQDRKQPDAAKEDIAEVSAATKPIIDTFGTLVFFIVVVEIVLTIGLNLYQKSRVNTITTEIQRIKTTLAAPDNATINNQVNEVLDGSDKLKDILLHKSHWSKFYTLLDGDTPKNVKLTSLSITESGSFRAEGTTGTLSDLASLIVAWRTGTATVTSPFTNIDLTNNGFSDQGGHRLVTFTVSGQVNKGILR